ncbi:MAG: N-acetyltransferase, partial [Actinobacteria bacterium]|nr:N-acetyltransferase [Actinomycetota bacterium]
MKNIFDQSSTKRKRIDPDVLDALSADTGRTASLDLEMAWGWNARVAAKISEIMSGINPKVVSGARSVTPTLKRADPNNVMWTYTVPGSKGETYTVKVKGIPKGNVRAVSKMDVLVSCSCPFFRYQGPEHWAKVGDYLYGKPAGTAATPDQKDPDGRNRVCKHVAAVFERAGNFFYTPPKGKTAATTPVPDRFAPNEAGVLTRDEYIQHLNPDDKFHPSTAYNYSTFDLNERYARWHLGTTHRTNRPPLGVVGSTSGTLFIDEDDRPVAVLHGGTLYHNDQGNGIPDEYHPARGGPVPLDIRARRRVKYIDEYIARVDDLARRTATQYPVVLRRFVHGGEPMTLRAEEQPAPDKGVNMVVADSAGRIIGIAQNEWGATLIAVAREARGRGIGVILSKVWHELNPSFGSGGMTSAGNALTQSVWADRVREFLSFGWYTQMVRDGRMTPERVR